MSLYYLLNQIHNQHNLRLPIYRAHTIVKIRDNGIKMVGTNVVVIIAMVRKTLFFKELLLSWYLHRSSFRAHIKYVARELLQTWISDITSAEFHF